ncbi:DUF1097 domain-containing protein [Streptomyces sp. NPDC088785]|uniref:DUF1097 domain-containing protein n=1 Tax=Streptomyces sp. NPDC088785 TaxID=3365897 RepID=UPI00381DDD37
MSSRRAGSSPAPPARANSWLPEPGRPPARHPRTHPFLPSAFIGGNALHLPPWAIFIGRLARDTFQALVVLVVNSALMYAGRLRALALVPGMFFGFACYFATYFGGFGHDPGDEWVAWLSVVAMNALGPVFAYLSVKLTFATADGPHSSAPRAGAEPVRRA